MLHFPNPFNNYIAIENAGNFEYTVYNSTGQIEEEGSGTNRVEVGQGLKTGLYFVLIHSGEKSQTIKITKE